MINLAIIPARGGSKGLPGKNIIDLNGKPLISYTIEAAITSQLFDRVIVSTDDRSIAEVSANTGAEILMRPSTLAQDETSSLAVIEHTLSEYELTSGSFCLLQPTSPLRNANHIKEAAILFQDCAKSSVISATELMHHPLKSLIKQSNGRYAPLRSTNDLVSPRQNLPRAIAANGAIYLCDIARFKSTGNLFFDDTEFYQMLPEESVDIDTHDDFTQASEFLKSKSVRYE
jgi:CMP-N-acetylneuraminic acid synthetase